MKGNSSGETTPLINAQMRGGLSGRVIGAVLFIVAAVVLTAMRIQNEAIDQQLQFSSTAAKARNNSATTTSLHPSGTKGMAVPHAEGKAGEKGESGGDGGACATIDKAAAYEVTPVNSWTEIAEYQVFTDPRYAAAKSKVASIKAATGSAAGTDQNIYNQDGKLVASSHEQWTGSFYTIQVRDCHGKLLASRPPSKDGSYWSPYELRDADGQTIASWDISNSIFYKKVTARDHATKKKLWVGSCNYVSRWRPSVTYWRVDFAPEASGMAADPRVVVALLSQKWIQPGSINPHLLVFLCVLVGVVIGSVIPYCCIFRRDRQLYSEIAAAELPRTRESMVQQMEEEKRKREKREADRAVAAAKHRDEWKQWREKLDRSEEREEQ